MRLQPHVLGLVLLSQWPSVANAQMIVACPTGVQRLNRSDILATGARDLREALDSLTNCKSSGASAPIKPTVADEQTAAGQMRIYDANQDAAVTAEEWARVLLATFDRQDLDHDARLTLVEVSPAAAAAGQKVSLSGDADKDGAVSRAEQSAAAQAQFTAADANKDGLVSLNELTQAVAKARTARR